MNGRPSRDEVLLAIAALIAKRGTCSRAMVGCVIARDGRILVSGYNGAPAGMPHCGDDPRHEKREDYSEMCRDSGHAEGNAIAYAARHGISLEGGTLYTTHTPCLYCAQLIINAGITRVLALGWYRDDSGHRLLKEAGVEIALG